MARHWNRLSESTRKRYLARGRTLGQSAEQVRRHYESGGRMSVYRGHPTRPGGVSERTWTRLRAAAKRARLHQDGDVTLILESLLSKGFSATWIETRLNEKADSRDQYRSPFARALRAAKIDAGWQPGRRRWRHRSLVADIEIYFYH